MSNWLKLKDKVATTHTNPKRPHISTLNTSSSSSNNKNTIDLSISKSQTLLNTKMSNKIKSNYIAIDCEMVGLGENGKTSALARCCVVDYDGNTLYDEFVRPPGYVTDFRTKWSGVRKGDLRKGEAVTLHEVTTPLLY